MEKEPIIIVETLKEFYTIILGKQLKVYTDHKHLPVLFSNRKMINMETCT